MELIPSAVVVVMEEDLATSGYEKKGSSPPVDYEYVRGFFTIFLILSHGS
jgi:hypothetical protein